MLIGSWVTRGILSIFFETCIFLFLCFPLWGWMWLNFVFLTKTNAKSWNFPNRCSAIFVRLSLQPIFYFSLVLALCHSRRQTLLQTLLLTLFFTFLVGWKWQLTGSKLIADHIAHPKRNLLSENLADWETFSTFSKKFQITKIVFLLLCLLPLRWTKVSGQFIFKILVRTFLVHHFVSVIFCTVES